MKTKKSFFQDKTEFYTAVEQQHYGSNYNPYLDSFTIVF
jgi:hypothetical protein